MAYMLLEPHLVVVPIENDANDAKVDSKGLRRYTYQDIEPAFKKLGIETACKLMLSVKETDLLEAVFAWSSRNIVVAPSHSARQKGKEMDIQ